MPRAAHIEFLQLPVPGQTLGENREIQIEQFAMQAYLQNLHVVR